MASLNRVMLIGNLGRDPELRYTQSQVPVCTLNIATTDVRRDKEGNRQELTEWHRVVVWNKQAENCTAYLTKGRSVFVEGRLQTRSWEDANGQKRYITEIVAQNVTFLGSGNRAETSRGVDDQAGSQEAHDQAGMAPHSALGEPEAPGLPEIPF